MVPCCCGRFADAALCLRLCAVAGCAAVGGSSVVCFAAVVGNGRGFLMPCFHPSKAWLPLDGGRAVLRFPVGDDPLDYWPTVVPCRRCQGCIAVRARDLGLRASHEAAVSKASAFLTLTYDNDHLPAYGGLCRDDLVLFMKRLRKDSAARGVQLRAYAVGEYGGRTLRPHYHLCLFGEDFSSDRVLCGKSVSGYPMFDSARLERLWGKGFCRINFMGVEVAQYAAKYAMKAVGDSFRVQRRQDADGVWHTVESPFDSLPHGRALGLPWLDRFASDVFPRGVVLLRGGVELPAPGSYLKWYAERDPAGFDALKAQRLDAVMASFRESLSDRLVVRETVLRAKVAQKARGL